MPFTFEKYGTFTGPGPELTFRENDIFETEPFTGFFNLGNVGMVLVNRSKSPADYAFVSLNGTSTAQLNIGRSTGTLSLLNVQSTTSLFSGEVYSNGGGHRLSAKKNFDIPHPNKDGWRLRHTCLEGPENAVYFRGRLTGSNTIELPEYWNNFVDPESITVNLTQIGSQQDLIVDRIEWGKKIIIRSGSGCSIDCYYIVHGNRKDGENLIVEYEGKTPNDYPGNNEEYSIVGWNYDVREPKKKK